MARIYSKPAYPDKQRIVSSMVNALRIYENVYQDLKMIPDNTMSEQLLEHMRICDEMRNLLPSKINKINNDHE
jgi:hypothetical protein